MIVTLQQNNKYTNQQKKLVLLADLYAVTAVSCSHLTPGIGGQASVVAQKNTSNL